MINFETFIRVWAKITFFRAGSEWVGTAIRARVAFVSVKVTPAKLARWYFIVVFAVIAVHKSPKRPRFYLSFLSVVNASTHLPDVFIPPVIPRFGVAAVLPTTSPHYGYRNFRQSQPKQPAWKTLRAKSESLTPTPPISRPLQFASGFSRCNLPSPNPCSLSHRGTPVPPR